MAFYEQKGVLRNFTFWREKIGAKKMARKKWREKIGAKKLVRKKWREKIGAKIKPSRECRIFVLLSLLDMNAFKFVSILTYSQKNGSI